MTRMAIKEEINEKTDDTLSNNIIKDQENKV